MCSWLLSQSLPLRLGEGLEFADFPEFGLPVFQARAIEKSGNGFIFKKAAYRTPKEDPNVTKYQLQSFSDYCDNIAKPLPVRHLCQGCGGMPILSRDVDQIQAAAGKRIVYAPQGTQSPC
jgi:hypothetical protein